MGLSEPVAAILGHLRPEEEAHLVLVVAVAVVAPVLLVAAVLSVQRHAIHLEQRALQLRQ